MAQGQSGDGSPESAWSVVGQHAGWGLTIAAAMGFFLFLGYQIDRRIGTLPLLTVLGALLGAAAGFYSMYRRLVADPQERRAGQQGERSDRKQPPDGAS